MPSPILIEAGIKVALRRKENAISFVKTYMGATGHKPSDSEIALHLECHG